MTCSLKQFNEAPGAETGERLSALADIQANLPDDVRIGDYFRGVRIVRADSLTLRPFVNARREPDFDPVLVAAHRPQASIGIAEVIDRRPVLPESPEREWQRFFRGFGQVRPTYPAGSGWYVVVSEPLREALQVVKRFQHAAPEERRSFLRQPRAFLAEQLGERLPSETLDALFWESAEYSERIRDIGIWTPRVIAYLRPSGQEWLPPAEVGIRIDDVTMAVEPAEVPALRQAIHEAIERGDPTVTFKSQPVPATPETLAALDQVERAASPRPAVARPTEEAPQEPGPIALLIKDNLEEVGYQSPPRAAPGGIGRQPQVLKSRLLPHQEDGCRWLQELWSSGARGGLLADDMGLAKTLQALTFLAWVQEQERATGCTARPILTVGPTGLLKNWRAEHDLHLDARGLGDIIEAHGPGLRALRLPDAARGNELGGGLPVLDVERLRAADWVLTTYETLRDYQHSFGRLRWKVAVFDEAQKIKNPATQMTDAAKAVNADFWLALTGTPVENSLSDLWSVVDTIRAGALGSLKDFMATYDTVDESGAEKLSRLKALLQDSPSPVLKRRMKADHLDGLPALHVHVLKRTMPEPQACAYADAVHNARARTGAPGNMLAALHRMRAVSLHPRSRGDESDEAFVRASARTAQCFEILDAIRDRRQKALIFLEDIDVQAQLAEIIQRRYGMPSPPLLITGAVAGPRRRQRVDVFQERSGFDVMLLSPRAGGVGLTITAANHVIHLARWWNPAVEDQCTDRVYRIGQARDVHVYLPMAIHPEFGDFSFDVRLHALLESKRTLSQAVLAPSATTESDLEGLYREAVEQRT